jgi:hypothetical protein
MHLPVERVVPEQPRRVGKRIVQAGKTMSLPPDRIDVIYRKVNVLVTPNTSSGRRQKRKA